MRRLAVHDGSVGLAAGTTALLLALALYPTCLVKADTQSYDAADEFSITNGNPNGTWSYGWMATDFTGFTLYSNTWWGDGVNPSWWGWAADHTPCIWRNLSDGEIHGVQPNQISIHPGDGQQPSVLRWTSPLTG